MLPPSASCDSAGNVRPDSLLSHSQWNGYNGFFLFVSIAMMLFLGVLAWFLYSHKDSLSDEKVGLINSRRSS